MQKKYFFFFQKLQRKSMITNNWNFMNFFLSVLKCKTIFDRLEPEELRKARTRSNPFETIRGCFFLNRAAMKMANMDAVFDFMFTNPSRLFLFILLAKLYLELLPTVIERQIIVIKLCNNFQSCILLYLWFKNTFCLRYYDFIQKIVTNNLFLSNFQKTSRISRW